MAGFDDGPQQTAPLELLAVWGETREAAWTAAWCLDLNARQVFCVGNDGGDVLRGLLPTRVLILPGADSTVVQEALTVALARRPGIPVLDLRPVQA